MIEQLNYGLHIKIILTRFIILDLYRAIHQSLNLWSEKRMHNNNRYYIVIKSRVCIIDILGKIYRGKIVFVPRPMAGSYMQQFMIILVRCGLIEKFG